MDYIEALKTEIQGSTNIVELIEFIETCQKVCHDQKEIIHKADFLHNQALEGIKRAKKRIKELNQ